MRSLVLLVTALSAVSAARAEVPVDEKPLSGTVQPRPALSTQAVPAADGSPAVQWDIYQQLQQLQQEVRQLRGQLEVQANQIERLKQDARSRYVDLDQRLNQMGGRLSALTAAPAVDSTATAAAPPATTPVTAPDAAAAKPATAEDEKKAYFAAYEVFRSGGPNKAINPMREFIKTYPQSSYIPGAYYWLGEFYLAASPADVGNARKSFRIVVDQFPDSPKTPAALYKLASLADVDGKTQEAARYLQDIVRRFGSSPEAASARVWLKEHGMTPAVAEKPKPTDAAKPGSATKAPAPKSEAKPDGKAAKPAPKPAEKAKTP